MEKEQDRSLFDITKLDKLVSAILLQNKIPKLKNILLFIDEIQESSNAIQMLRFFYEEVPWLHVIAAGSLLEFVLGEVRSFPVGRVEFLYLYPCNIMEYLDATQNEVAQNVLQEIPIHEYADFLPHFWVREQKNSNAEVDLVYPAKNLVIPIEIKSGPTATLRSLHQFVDSSVHPYAVRIYSGKFSVERHTTPSGKEFILMNIPYYLVTKLPAYLNYFVETYS